MEDFRSRQFNDRPAALEAKYDPDDPIQTDAPIEADTFLAGFTKKLQDQRSLKPGDRALKGKVGQEINAPERVANYM